MKGTEHKLIVLDRDGVINQDSDNYIKSVDEFIPIPGSLEAIARLNGAGYRVVVATNQSGIARGLFEEAELHRMHEKLDTLLQPLNGRIDKFYFCPHGPGDNCQCRKPEPGLLQQILRDYNVDAADVVAVGDSLRDLQAAQAVAMVPVLVRTGKGLITEKTISEQSGKNGDAFANLEIYNDLSEAVDTILASG